MGFPRGSTGKESICNVRDLGSIPGLGRSPGERNGYPLQYSGLENSTDCVVHGVAKSRTRLSNFHFHSQKMKVRGREVRKRGRNGRAGILSVEKLMLRLPSSEHYLLCLPGSSDRLLPATFIPVAPAHWPYDCRRRGYLQLGLEEVLP